MFCLYFYKFAHICGAIICLIFKGIFLINLWQSELSCTICFIYSSRLNIFNWHEKTCQWPWSDVRILFVFIRYSSPSPETFRRQEPCHPLWDTILDMTVYCAGLSAMLFDGGNSNYHSNGNCHTKVVGVPRAVDKVLPVSIYSNYILFTLLTELFEVFSVLTSGSDSHFYFPSLY